MLFQGRNTRAKCYFEWAAEARKGADLKAAEYLTALANECLEDAAALDAAENKIPARPLS